MNLVLNLGKKGLNLGKKQLIAVSYNKMEAEWGPIAFEKYMSQGEKTM